MTEFRQIFDIFAQAKTIVNKNETRKNRMAMNMDETSIKTRVIDNKSNTKFPTVKVKSKANKIKLQRWPKKIKRPICRH